LQFTRLDAVRASLTSGDYSVLGLEHLFAIERKSIPDLVACCCSGERERFERELHRLRGFRFARLLIVGERVQIEEGEYRSQARPKSVLNSLAAFEARYNVPVVFSPTPETAAEQVEAWAYWFAREVCESANGLLRGHKRQERKASNG
jgi:ERCC4-type nuclease